MAIGGFVLAYVDAMYESGTELIATKDGYLTKANILDKLFYRQAIVDKFFKNPTL